MLLGIRVVAAVLSVTIFLVSVYAWTSYRTLQTKVTHIDAIVAPTTSASASVSASASKKPGVAENILLVGDDHRPANASAAEMAQLHVTDDGGAVNTDTMMVMHIPADGSKATIISFPRDSWVSIPGFGKNKLNSAFEFGSENGGGDAGGAQLLIKVIQNMTGLTINHFVRVSLIGFYEIAQVLGPIKVCLNAAAKEPLSGINLPAGVSYLTPSQALSFVRQRHDLPRGDLDREARQQYFLAAALAKIDSAGTLANPFKLQSLLSAVGSSLETDSGLNLLTFAQQFSNLGSGNVTYATIPITGTPTITVDGTDVSIVAVNTAAMPAFISSILAPATATASATPSPASTSATAATAPSTPASPTAGSSTASTAPRAYTPSECIN